MQKYMSIDNTEIYWFVLQYINEIRKDRGIEDPEPRTARTYILRISDAVVCESVTKQVK